MIRPRLFMHPVDSGACRTLMFEIAKDILEKAVRIRWVAGSWAIKKAIQGPRIRVAHIPFCHGFRCKGFDRSMHVNGNRAMSEAETRASPLA
jgi:hypothetical protein